MITTNIRQAWRTLSRTICGAGLLLVLASSVSAPTVSAVDFFDDICNQNGASTSTACNTDGSNELTGSKGVITRVTNVVALISAVAAVIIMIVGGFMYVISNGDSSKVTTAKNTLIYAGVGLVIIAVSRSIIYFVIDRL
jgi:hypothetical protein